jgi:hypothetical protein
MTLLGGAIALGAVAVMVTWLGWVGILVPAAVLGGFLLWFYCGPRPDVPSPMRGVGKNRVDRE